MNAGKAHAGLAARTTAAVPSAAATAATVPSAAATAAAVPPVEAWGEGLAYPERVRRFLPAVHDGFTAVNKYVSVPALKMGLGRYMSNPLTGYLMILRTRGRKSGELRDAPLGYVVVGEHLYCLAGFGRRTHWYQNILADPHVEVILPGRAFSGAAEEVTDPEERRRILAPLLRSMGVVAAMVGMGNPWRDGPDEIYRKCEGMPLVRVRATGVAAGPEDPGGRYWAVPVVGGTVLAAWWLRGRCRNREKA
ncbi:MAG: nitroreductase/quinone reductase family protein [Candidatus Limnocylindrales bacterium]|jgi:deazaflavin-dependent oxidoreductase (nitroreductase family)